MFASIKYFAAVLACASVVASAPYASTTSGTIQQPSDGARLQPGQNFPFKYIPRADYETSTFGYHVWLVDGSGDANAVTFGDGSNGYYYGRYEYPNYPVAMNVSNPAPYQLTVPDFSQSQGFAAGTSGANVNMRLVVIEEWGNNSPAFGHHLSVASSSVIYNSTQP